MKYFLVILVATIMFSCSYNSVSNDIKSQADSLKADSLRMDSIKMDSIKKATTDTLKITNIKK